MDDNIYKERIQAILRVLDYAKIIKEDSIPCKIEEGLYLGSVGTANNKSALKSLNITHVLTIANSLIPAHPKEFIYKVVQVPDRADVLLSQYFDECFAFIEEAKLKGGGVLVHCFRGISRSVTVTVAYLMLKNGMNLPDALGHVKMRRPVACPNNGFMIQLRDYEKSLQAKTPERQQNIEKCSSSSS